MQANYMLEVYFLLCATFVRFDEKMDNEETKIKFMTDGLLVRELMSDPLLKKFVFLYEQNYILHRRYSVIMLDEVHERTLYSDVIIGLLKKVCRS